MSKLLIKIVAVTGMCYLLLLPVASLDDFWFVFVLKLPIVVMFLLFLVLMLFLKVEEKRAVREFVVLCRSQLYDNLSTLERLFRPRSK